MVEVTNILNLTEKSTDDLFEMIESDPENFMEKVDSEKLMNYKSIFNSYFNQLMKEKGLSIGYLVVRTTLSQSYLYQIASGVRRLGRDNAIILAFAMALSLEQTQRLLRYSNNAILYPKVRRDAIIICCINCNMTCEQADDMLLKHSEKGLIS